MPTTTEESKMFYKLLIMFGYGTVDGAIAGLKSSLLDLQRVQGMEETKAEVADAQAFAHQVRRDEATAEAERAARIFAKFNDYLS